jgi:hypothetical protein
MREKDKGYNVENQLQIILRNEGRVWKDYAEIITIIFFYYFINSYCNICLLLYFWINLLQSVFRIYPNP